MSDAVLAEIDRKAVLAAIKQRIKTLAAQSQMLRLMETRCSDPIERQDARYRRVVTTRQASRGMLLLYGYLRGRTYLAIEPVAQLGYRNNAYLSMWWAAGELARQLGHEGRDEYHFRFALLPWPVHWKWTRELEEDSDAPNATPADGH